MEVGAMAWAGSSTGIVWAHGFRLARNQRCKRVRRALLGLDEVGITLGASHSRGENMQNPMRTLFCGG